MGPSLSSLDTVDLDRACKLRNAYYPWGTPRLPGCPEKHGTSIAWQYRRTLPARRRWYSTVLTTTDCNLAATRLLLLVFPGPSGAISLPVETAASSAAYGQLSSCILLATQLISCDRSPRNSLQECSDRCTFPLGLVSTELACCPVRPSATECSKR